ncbi:uncharacterized protein FFMR_13367 [Fusarium fujikuroi]|nr:uncharacterized protein FFMR_13367 [Fusarium fujikuroi]
MRKTNKSRFRPPLAGLHSPLKIDQPIPRMVAWLPWQMTQEKRALEGFSEEPDETLGRCGRAWYGSMVWLAIWHGGNGRVPALINVQRRSNRDREVGLRKSQ